MQITVLGKSPSWQDAAGACSGYLVQEGDFTLLLDCGNGVFSKLRRDLRLRRRRRGGDQPPACRPLPRSVPFSYALSYAPRQQPVPVGGWPGTDHPARPELYGPDGSPEVFRRVVGCWGSEDLVEQAFDLHEYAVADELSIGPLRIRFCEVPHFMATYAVEMRQQRLALHLQRRLQAQRGAGELRPGQRPAADRGDPAPARAHRRARPSDSARGRRARPAGARAAAGADPLLRRAGRRSGRARRRREATAGRSSWRTRAATGLRAVADGWAALDPKATSDVRARSVCQLRAHAARDGRAVRRRVRATRAVRRRRASWPAVDVAYASDPPRAIVTAELAGVEIDELGAARSRVAQLVLAGRRGPAADEGEVYQQVEIERGPFRRVIELGAEVHAEEARARYEDGMLRVELPLVQHWPRPGRAHRERRSTP